MNPLELYLNRVTRELRSMPEWKREEELRELRSHLEQRVEDFERHGLKVEDAQTKAVEAFGAPKALGGKLCDAWEGVPTSWRGVAAVALRMTLIWFMSIMLLWAPIVVLSNRELLQPPIAFIGFIFFVELAIILYCGILLSLRTGRHGIVAVLALLLLVALLNVGILAVQDYFPEGFTYEYVSGLSLWMLYINCPLWLLETVIYHFFRVRRLRNLPPGQTPRAKSSGLLVAKARFGRAK